MLICLALLSGSAQAQLFRSRSGKEQSKNSDTLKTAFRELATPVAKSTHQIKSDGKSAALGVAVDADGFILTKASQLKGKVTCVLKDGREVEAKIVGVMESHDLAMLKVEAKGLVPVAFIDGAGARVGQWLASVGPTAQPFAVGVVSVGRRKIPWQNPSIVLGVGLEDVDDGIRVVMVMPESGAAKAGIKARDIIRTFQGRAINSRDELVELIQGHRQGDKVKVGIKRGEEDLELETSLSRRPAGPASRSDRMNALGGALSERSSGFSAVLQHDTVLKPHECGGAVIDLDGKVIGLNIARAGRTESYALPADVIKPLLAELKSGKLAPRPPPATTRATTGPSTGPATLLFPK